MAFVSYIPYETAYLYGSDAGTVMTTIYYSFIRVVKLHSSSVWEFIKQFSKSSLYLFISQSKKRG